MTGRPWRDVLAELDSSLAAVEAALDAEDWDALDAGDWRPPSVDAALGPELLPLAEALAARAAACERRLEAAMRGRATELGELATRRRAAARYTEPQSSSRP